VRACVVRARARVRVCVRAWAGVRGCGVRACACVWVCSCVCVRVCVLAGVRACVPE